MMQLCTWANPTLSDRSCIKGLRCWACCMLLLWQGRDWLLSWKDISMNLQFKKVTKKSLLQNKGHFPLVPYGTKQRNKHLYAVLSCPTACKCTHWPEHPDKPVLSQHLNIMRMKLKLHK